MNPDDLKKILDALSHADVREFSLTTGSFALDLKRGPQAVGMPTSAGASAPAPHAAPSFQPPAASNAAPALAEAPSAPAPTTPASTPAETPAPAAPPAKPASAGTPVKAPIVGTFYASSSPDAAPYVKVGDTVQAGQVLCIIEAMKLMNEIEAEASGTLREILVKNAEPVEYGQTLFIIE
ncbi:acetyl-CoA carboxylase biotin carboxyl carrier protein [Deinococcus sp. MIMF12]|uniref:Biotin carboxyl carrier protein of acetyl-CoA carboxylase n=1 Tax=Deinococcus rhizophilus TaxID=3049544 RepID=A0ABT7JHK1_9DEIO|nr:acetyl-CoA carboxylase biotin carboxyl carrier protein [Deinococcus rhizophilus]MDL2344529.1 acetyl-CoA carboxylase biotin carboxyl carrier protein [Deinococcus rhizophilus]